MKTDSFIACGMYAFTPSLQRSWQTLFDHFIDSLGESSSVRRTLEFGHSNQIMLHPKLYIGQTCGYPLVTALHPALTPICVASFEVDGFSDSRYSSHLIVHADADINELAQCAGMRAAINNLDSNSGMNLLRYELASIGASKRFLSGVELTGGHLQSFTAIAEKRVDIAAIDCVSYRLITDQWPQLASRVRSIGLSHATAALPFVMPTAHISVELAQSIIQSLNRATAALPEVDRERLHLLGFNAITLEQYDEISEFESFAIKRGLAQLN